MRKVQTKFEGEAIKMRLTVNRQQDGRQDERHPRPRRLVSRGCRKQQVVAGEGDDVEGVLPTVDGLEERVEGEAGLVGVVKGEAALGGPLRHAVLAKKISFRTSTPLPGFKVG